MRRRMRIDGKAGLYNRLNAGAAVLPTLKLRPILRPARCIPEEAMMAKVD